MEWNVCPVPCPADSYLDLYSICSFDKPFKILTRIKRGLRVNSVSFTKVVISFECRRLSRPVNHMSSRDVQFVSYIPFPRNARKMPLNCNNNINNPFPLPLFFQETTHGGGQGQGQGGQGQQRESGAERRAPEWSQTGSVRAAGTCAMLKDRRSAVCAAQ